MNSYWAGQYARQHLDQMVADARGDTLVADAERQASDRREPAAPAPLRRARSSDPGIRDETTPLRGTG